MFSDVSFESVFSILQYINQRYEHKGRWVGIMQTTTVPGNCKLMSQSADPEYMYLPVYLPYGRSLEILRESGKGSQKKYNKFRNSGGNGEVGQYCRKLLSSVGSRGWIFFGTQTQSLLRFFKNVQICMHFLNSVLRINFICGSRM